MENAPEGWYPDPQGLADERYYDGTGWTDKTRKTQMAGTPKREPTIPSGGDSDLLRGNIDAQLATASFTRVVALGVMLVIGLSVLAGIGASAALSNTSGSTPTVTTIAGLASLIYLVVLAFLIASAFSEARNRYTAAVSARDKRTR